MQHTELSDDAGKISGENEETTSPLTHLKQSRIQLPMWGFKAHVLAAIEKEQVVIVCGETGW